MNTPLITWSCTVGLFIIIVLVRLYHYALFSAKNKRNLLDFLSEREEFFIPGDPLPRKENENDYDDFDDL